MNKSFYSGTAEFVIIGLPMQLAELNRPTIFVPNSVTLAPVSSARNQYVILMQRSIYTILERNTEEQVKEADVMNSLRPSEMLTFHCRHK